ncbi:MAG: helicase-related protein [Rubripirellula sp.]
MLLSLSGQTGDATLRTCGNFAAMELIDNINSLLGDDLRRTIRPGAKLRIAASCFSIYAFEALRAELEKIDSLQFIFTSPTFIPNEVTDSGKKVAREYFIPKAERERNVYGTEFEIQLKNKLTQRAIAKECAEWMRRKAQFRSNRTKAPMQQFACVSGTSQDAASDAVYMPLHGFTAVDLGYQKGDAVSNFINKGEEDSFTQTFIGLFDQIWNDSQRIDEVTDRLCDHIASIYQENAPERIYFQMLYNIFAEFLEDVSGDTLPNDMTGYQDTLVWNKLFNFQHDAATGIINKLETFNGCILADSVGLGKTFTALAVIKYYELRNRSVLVLCPKKLSDNWLTFNRNVKTNLFAKDRFNYDVLCHTDLGRTRGESFGTRLDQVNWGNYDLVVIDESHNFRNADAFAEKETRYEKLMNAVIRAGVQTKVLMLSATPVNNRFNDLKNQLALAYEGDTEAINRKLDTSRDIGEIFRRAQTAFNAWAKLPAEQRTGDAILKSLDFDFFKLLDSVTIARSRRHIQTFYDTAEVGTFPTRLPPQSYRCPLTHRGDVPNLNEIYNSLASLKLAVYAPVAYIHPSRLAHYAEQYDVDTPTGNKFKQIDRERSLQNLMTVNLLKRLESSIEAFRITLSKLQRNHRGLLAKIDEFQRTGKSMQVADAGAGYGNYDEDEVLDPGFAEDGAVTTGKVQIRLEDMDLPSWQADLQRDLEIIDELLGEMQKVTPKDDAKLQHLLGYIKEKFASPINAGNRKVLIFTAFADTSEYLYEHLAPAVAAYADAAAGTINHSGGHTATVSGTFPPRSTIEDANGRPRRYDFQSILTLFSPRSKEKSLIMPDEPAEIDVLIGTDCISEGQNLQDCDCVINYDIHWNPVRIIQRFGRVDRIGSPNSCIQLVNYWPDITLDDYINLKERVENRMVIADMTATGDDNVLLDGNAENSEVAYRKEQLRRLQDEVIEMEDVKTGVSITDLGLNDFRMDLLAYVKETGDLANVPNGMHSVVPADPDRGLHPGVIFTLRNRDSSVNVGGHNRLHPYYLVYVASDGSVVIDHTEVKRLLDLARSACKGRKKHVEEVCKPFNDATDDGRDMKVYSDLLDTAISSIIDRKAETDVDSLFSGGPTTALEGDIKGLDDFELITFLVIFDPARGE